MMLILFVLFVIWDSYEVLGMISVTVEIICPRRAHYCVLGRRTMQMFLPERKKSSKSRLVQGSMQMLPSVFCVK